MLYQEKYMAGGDPTKLNISACVYIHDHLPQCAENLSTQTTPREIVQNDHYSYIVSQHGYPMHCHSFYEIAYHMDGSSEYVVSNRSHPVKKGSMVLFAPLVLHSIQNDYCTRHLLIHFSPRILHNCLPSLPSESLLFPAGDFGEKGVLQIPEGSDLDKLFLKLIDIVPHFSLSKPENEIQITQQTISEEIQLTAILYNILMILNNKGYLKVCSTEIASTSISGMQELLSRIINNPAEKISMEEAATLTGMSYSNFCRAFKKAMGTSYVEFCNMIRINKAQENLIFQDTSITQIAASLNFGSVSYFNRIFKKVTGETPFAYRTHHRTS